MHDIDFDINLEEISKIEGAASLEIKIRNSKIRDLKFSISEWKRFYTQAIRGKPSVAVPQLVSRICGTCSVAHLLASAKAVEDAGSIKITEQTKILRRLLYNGLIIRDHALHLYIFALPDIFNKDSILDFDTNDPLQHKLLDDTFEVKEVGNQMAIIIAGRSVHPPFTTVGGFTKLPAIDDLKKIKPELIKIRPKILELIKIFAEAKFKMTLRESLTYSALASNEYSYLEGTMKICTSEEVKKGSRCHIVTEANFKNYLEEVIIPYSHARGFKYKGQLIMVGALPRLNINKNSLHPKTKQDTKQYLKMFPSNNIFHNNLAQAIETLQAIDDSCDIIDNLKEIKAEKLPLFNKKESVGVGVIEAPRGTLYYKLKFNDQGAVTWGEIIVPSGQNQILMERAIFELVEQKLENESFDKDQIIIDIESLIRAFDPCMSCASHFLKVNWL
jgi:coenzyme F420-reducing hydrogenase alpha subunit